MDAKTIFRDLFGHMEWADAIVWRAVRELGNDDPRLHELLQHTHGTQRAFLSVWLELPLDRGMFAEHTLDSVNGWARDFHRDAAQFLAALDAAALDRPLSVPWAKRFAKDAHATTLGETLLQVASHSTHHRAQISMRIRELGGTPPLADYIAWLWLGRPPAEW